VAQNTRRRGGNAIEARTTRHVGDRISQHKCKQVEQCFGWAKHIGPMRQVVLRDWKAQHLLKHTIAAYSLTRLRTLAAVCP
jgi:hypothetical protein